MTAIRQSKYRPALQFWITTDCTSSPSFELSQVKSSQIAKSILGSAERCSQFSDGHGGEALHETARDDFAPSFDQTGCWAVCHLTKRCAKSCKERRFRIFGSNSYCSRVLCERHRLSTCQSLRRPAIYQESGHPGGHCECTKTCGTACHPNFWWNQNFPGREEHIVAKHHSALAAGEQHPISTFGLWRARRPNFDRCLRDSCGAWCRKVCRGCASHSAMVSSQSEAHNSLSPRKPEIPQRLLSRRGRSWCVHSCWTFVSHFVRQRNPPPDHFRQRLRQGIGHTRGVADRPGSSVAHVWSCDRCVAVPAGCCKSEWRENTHGAATAGHSWIPMGWAHGTSIDLVLKCNGTGAQSDGKQLQNDKTLGKNPAIFWQKPRVCWKQLEPKRDKIRLGSSSKRACGRRCPQDSRSDEVSRQGRRMEPNRHPGIPAFWQAADSAGPGCWCRQGIRVSYIFMYLV